MELFNKLNEALAMKKVINLLQLLSVLNIEYAHRHVRLLPILDEKHESRRDFDFLGVVVRGCCRSQSYTTVGTNPDPIPCTSGTRPKI